MSMLKISGISIVISTVNILRSVTILHTIKKILEELHEIPNINLELIIIAEKDRQIVKFLEEKIKRMAYRLPKSIRSRVSFRVIFSKWHLGLSGARNLGIKISQYDIISFLDDDIIPSNKWLSSILETFMRDINIVAAGGPVVPIVLFHTKYNDLIKYVFPYVFGSHPPTMWNYNGFVDFIIGSNMSFRKYIFNEIGYFNERLGFSYAYKDLIFNFVGGEETDLILRIYNHNKNAKIYMNKDAKVYHITDLRKISPFMLIRKIFAFGLSTGLVRYTTEIKDVSSLYKPRIHYIHSKYLINNWIKLFLFIIKNGEIKRRLYNILFYVFGSCVLLMGRIVGRIISQKLR